MVKDSEVLQVEGRVEKKSPSNGGTLKSFKWKVLKRNDKVMVKDFEVLHVEG
jgi:deoxyribodipyrimidine photolyase-like uncharacterized protein